MVRKKILVDIYLAHNLGDDMFLDHLSHSFPDIDFVPFHPGKNYLSFFKQYPNVLQFQYTFLDKIFSRFGKNMLTDYKRMSDDFDGLLFLGGGIFREESYWKEVYEYRTQISEAFKNKGKKVFFVGCNFGPYSSKEFLEAHKDLFRKIDQIIFRDQKSFQLFSDLSNVSYAPDVLWSYDLPAVQKEEKILGISVIDPRHKEQYKNTYSDYIEAHKKICEKYIHEGYKIILFSFCEKEGDLEIAKEIAKDFSSIEIQNYTQDINSYLKMIGSCSHFIAARFHAVIIALKYDVPVIPIIYGDKTENLLKDLNFEQIFIYLDTINQITKAEYGTISSEEIESNAIESKKHFQLEF